MQFLSIWDFVLLPFYVIIPFLLAKRKQYNHIEREPFYKYYTRGLMLKIFGGIGLCLIYCFYYQGGDTISYHKGAVAMSNLMFKDFSGYLSILSNNRSVENWMLFDQNTMAPPHYMYVDTLAFSVIRIGSLIALFGFQGLMLITVLVAWLTYSGIWRLYKLFVVEFPELEKAMAVAILFVPSVVFWGSGFLKDSFTLSASAWLVYSVFSLIRKRSRILMHIIILLVSSYIIISIKPYIFFALLVGIIFILTQINIKKIKSTFIRIIVLPIILLLLWGGGALLLVGTGEVVGGHYANIEKMLEKASITQQDLSREYYGKNSFDIGAFEPTIPGVLSKTFPAITAGLYRPFIWECSNPVMFISGLENSMLLLFSIYVLFITVVSVFKNGSLFISSLNEPLILFSFIFSLSFAFMVGLTTANFGAMVRYKIPLMPFFIASLIIVIYKFNNYKISLKEQKE